MSIFVLLIDKVMTHTIFESNWLSKVKGQGNGFFNKSKISCNIFWSDWFNFIKLDKDVWLDNIFHWHNFAWPWLVFKVTQGQIKMNFIVFRD